MVSLNSGAPLSTAQQAGTAGCHLPGSCPSSVLVHSFHPLGTGDGLGFLWVQEGRVYVCIPGRKFKKSRKKMAM